MDTVKTIQFSQVVADRLIDLDAEGLREAVSDGDALVCGKALVDVELVYEDILEATFDTVLFRSCVFEAVDFSRCTFRNVRFEECRFIRCEAERSWFSRCDLVSCSAPGFNMLGSRLDRVLFREVDLSYANMSEVKATQVLMRGSRLAEAAICDARLGHVALDDCDLYRIDIRGTKLSGIDLSSCRFEAPVLTEGYRELSGAIVSAQQALDLSALLGIVIADD
ncbi:MAG: pentapeptide repeat-containing protein [Collinsella sp.]|nr:pentapeptide repeat-containing protein [Collinsella sp.]